MAKKSKSKSRKSRRSTRVTKKTRVVPKLEHPGAASRNLGHLAFIAGVIVAVIAGISTNILDAKVVTLVLVILGLVVGFMNIQKREMIGFLVGAIALMVAGVADVVVIPYVGLYLQAILENIGTFVAPAAIVVAVKEVRRMAEE